MSRGFTGYLPGAATLVFGLLVCILARRLPAQSGFGLGPAFLPFWTGVLLSLCGLWLMILPEEKDRSATLDLSGGRRAAGGFLILLCYTLALEPLGYVLSTLGFLLGYVWFLYKLPPARALAVSFAGGLTLFLIFRLWLRVPLPGGVLGW